MARQASAFDGAGTIAALAAAALFGVGTPYAKRLLAVASPLLLSGLLYVGAGLALTLSRAVAARLRPDAETPLRRADLGMLAAIVACGGILGPLLMLVGLRRVSGVVGALLLNLEGPLTMVLAVALFGEHLGRRAGAAAALIALGAVVLTARGPSGASDGWGAVAIAAACVCWAIDNNLTQRLSLRDPIAIARAKSLAAGTCSMTAALALGARLPAPPAVVAALLLGAVSYGASLVLAIVAMRHIGAARQAAYFATAPFVGALAALPVLGERLGGRELAAAVPLVAGVVLLLRDRHAHRHAHEAMEHEHRHVHDAHHRHVHLPDDPPGEPHAHGHRHEPVTHAHAHGSDLHHRHRH
ncbi:MAG TPA: EamA family transporter [Candidatus Binatia bacterium]|jgi:drug/metabolite transporter (DMT)-like permease